MAGCTHLSYQALLKQTVPQYLLIILWELKTTCTWELSWLEKIHVLKSGPDAVEMMHKEELYVKGKTLKSYFAYTCS